MGWVCLHTLVMGSCVYSRRRLLSLLDEIEEGSSHFSPTFTGVSHTYQINRPRIQISSAPSCYVKYPVNHRFLFVERSQSNAGRLSLGASVGQRDFFYFSKNKFKISHQEREKVIGRDVYMTDTCISFLTLSFSYFPGLSIRCQKPARDRSSAPTISTTNKRRGKVEHILRFFRRFTFFLFTKMPCLIGNLH